MRDYEVPAAGHVNQRICTVLVLAHFDMVGQ